MTEQSLLLIKPNAVVHRHVGHVISIIEEHGFVITNIKVIRFTRNLAERFYEMHRGKEFFERLVSFMCSADTVAVLLEKRNAVEELRELIGEVDPEKRKPGSIRHLYAEGITENAVHASDTIAHAIREIKIVFG
ncbi:MAG: nucleoside-diphosphate kinase [Candidatus Cloacimonadaceae bacterium]|nr:nucleoside-diphosphate kinase [Candidatus Cloacimonadaceae bacterium]MDP3114599.1 nucleoside-diphosphate kinase [Candidatus Cloacimonadaceae bacterium]